MASEVVSIVVTGGPCAGKTTALERLHTDLEGRGWKLLFVPEVATELIGGGIAPWTCRSQMEFQRSVFEMQLSKEESFYKAAERMPAERVLMICDRGLMDGLAYVEPEEFDDFLKAAKIDKTAALGRYDAVFHLLSTAQGLESAYTLSNNDARRESPELAAKVDSRTIAAWEDHPYLRVLDNQPTFESKYVHLFAEVVKFLESLEGTEFLD